MEGKQEFKHVDRDVHAAQNMARLGLTSLPLLRWEALVEGMFVEDRFIESASLFPVKQVMNGKRTTGSSQQELLVRADEAPVVEIQA